MADLRTDIDDDEVRVAMNAIEEWAIAHLETLEQAVAPVLDSQDPDREAHGS